MFARIAAASVRAHSSRTAAAACVATINSRKSLSTGRVCCGEPDVAAAPRRQLNHLDALKKVRAMLLSLLRPFAHSRATYLRICHSTIDPVHGVFDNSGVTCSSFYGKVISEGKGEQRAKLVYGVRALCCALVLPCAIISILHMRLARQWRNTKEKKREKGERVGR